MTMGDVAACYTSLSHLTNNHNHYQFPSTKHKLGKKVGPHKRLGMRNRAVVVGGVDGDGASSSTSTEAKSGGTVEVAGGGGGGGVVDPPLSPGSTRSLSFESSRDDDDIGVIIPTPTSSRPTTTTVTRRGACAPHAPPPWKEFLLMYISAISTFSYANVGHANVQVSIMTMIALVGTIVMQIDTMGSSLNRSNGMIIYASLGAFVGGHDVLGSTKYEDGKEEEDDEEKGGGTIPMMNYLWLLILSIVTGLLWHCVIDGGSRTEFLHGYAGRLGTTTFLGMNVVIITMYGPLGVVRWDRYYGGFVDTDVRVGGAEDAGGWDWTEGMGKEEGEDGGGGGMASFALCYVLGTMYLGIASGGTRLLHERRRLMSSSRSSRVDDDGENPPSPPHVPPLNNVVVPALWALTSMLLAYCYPSHSRAYYVGRVVPALFDGFAVGSYVGMSSLRRISSISKFAIVSLIASVWGLALTPLFVGFAGKSGFTATLGHLTHEALESIVTRTRARLQKRRRRDEKNRREESEEEEDDDLEEEDERRRLELAGHLDSASSRPRSSSGGDDPEEGVVRGREEDDGAMRPPPSPPRHGQYKPRREIYYTKQQRRQSQRLRHHLLREEQDGERRPSSSTTTTNDRTPTPMLHRAWSALPIDGDDGVWHHSLESQLD